MDGELDAAAEERADNRATASGIRPDQRRPVTTAAVRHRAHRRQSRPKPYNPPAVRPTKAHIEAGRAGLAQARAALAAATTPSESSTEEQE